MSTEPYPNESRLTALTRIETGLERLEKHMVALAEANIATRQMLEEERQAHGEQFRPVEPVRCSPFETFGPAGDGGGQT